MRALRLRRTIPALRATLSVALFTLVPAVAVQPQRVPMLLRAPLPEEGAPRCLGPTSLSSLAIELRACDENAQWQVADADPEGGRTIRHVISGNCLGRDPNGQRGLRFFNCGDGESVRWRLIQGPRRLQLQHLATGECLKVTYDAGRTPIMQTERSDCGRLLDAWISSSAATFTAAVPSIPVPPSAAARAAREITLRVASSGMCLTVLNTTPRAVVQAMCTEDSQQRWVIRPREYDAFGVSIQSRENGECLTVADAGLVERAPVLVTPCTNVAQQQWQSPTRAGVMQARAVHSGKCLSIEPGAARQGAPLTQMTCEPQQARQNFLLTGIGETPPPYPPPAPLPSARAPESVDEPFRPGEAPPAPPPPRPAQTSPSSPPLYPLPEGATVVTVRSEGAGSCLGMFRDADGVEWVAQQACDNQVAQQWVVTESSPRVVTLHARQNGRCLGIEEGRQDEVAGTLLQPCQGAAHQRWGVVVMGPGVVQLRAMHTGLCLTMRDRTGRRGSLPQQGSCDDANAQQRWVMTPVAPS